MSRRVSILGAVLLGALVGREAPARADENSGKGVAEALFRDAKALLEANDYEKACPKFADSQKLDPTLGTLLYLAACHEKQGRTASAWSEFSSARSWAQRVGQSDRAQFAQKHVEELERRLSHVVVSAPSIAGLQIKIDEAPPSASTIGTPLPLDPGPHTLEASAPGYRPWKKVVEVPQEAGKLNLTVPALMPLPPEAKQAPVAPEADKRSGSGRTIALAGSIGVTVAGAAVGTIFGLMTLDARESADRRCEGKPAVCEPGGLDDIRDARTNATVSTVGFGVAGAGLLVTAALLVFSDSGKPSSPRARAHARSHLEAPPPVIVVPAISPSGSGLSLQASFL